MSEQGGRLAERLQAGIESLQLDLDARQFERLIAYLDLLARWNRVYNLTAVREPLAMVDQHLLDCLAVVQPLRRQLCGAGERVVDVGSGAGLPGLVLAIAMPELASVTCVDAVGKKASFIRQAAAELGLTRLTALHARVETLPQASVDAVVSRAYSSLADFVRSTAGLLPAGSSAGVWMAMKGKRPDTEIDEVRPGVDVFHVEQLHQQTQGAAERCLIWMRPLS